MSILMVPDDGGVLWPSLGGLVCDFIENYLVFGPGDLRGMPAVLDDEKRALVWRAYEIYPKGHLQEGRRRFKRVVFSLRKGSAKTEVAAWMAACELHHEAPVRFAGWDKRGNPLGKPVQDPYVAMVAFSEEQTELLAYGALKAILEESPIADDFDIGLERIMRRRGDGRAEALASSPNARDGARTTFQHFDETHRMVLPNLKRAHTTMLANIAKRKLADGWSLETTTAPEPGADSVAETTMEYARLVTDGRLKVRDFFFFHRQASDEHDLTTEEGARAALIEASGPVAAWADIEATMSLWHDPNYPAADWERFFCNRLVKSSQKAFDTERWKQLKKESPAKDGDLIVLGFDGAQFRDSVGLVGTHVETGYQFVLGVWECPHGREDNWQVPVDGVDATVKAAFENYEVWRMYADPPYWQSWVSAWAGEFGADRVLEWWTNRRKAMSYALENFCTSMTSGDISHDGNDALLRHIGNSYRHDLPFRDEEGKPLWLIRKERSDSPFKIDLAMAAVLSWEARNDAIAAGAHLSKKAGIFAL